MRLPLLCGLLLLPLAAAAAINPAEFTKRAPLQLRLQPTVQIVEHFERDGGTQRRTTIVATVVAEHIDTAETAVGDTVTIDWTVDLDAQQREHDAHAERMAGRVGGQFLHAPLPPTVDADGLIWAHLRVDEPVATPAPGGGAADRRIGRILVPAASQYTFDPPSN